MSFLKQHGSSDINEVIKTVLNFLFFYGKILHAQKAQKEYKTPKDSFKLFVYFLFMIRLYTHKKHKKITRHQKAPIDSLKHFVFFG